MSAVWPLMCCQGSSSPNPSPFMCGPSVLEHAVVPSRCFHQILSEFRPVPSNSQPSLSRPLPLPSQCGRAAEIRRTLLPLCYSASAAAGFLLFCLPAISRGPHSFAFCSLCLIFLRNQHFTQCPPCTRHCPVPSSMTPSAWRGTRAV